MEINEILGFFLSTDPMRAPLAKTIEQGRALAVAYKELLLRKDAMDTVNKTLFHDLAQEKEARNKDKQFSDKELARLANAPNSSDKVMNKLLEIENLLLRGNNASKKKS